MTRSLSLGPAPRQRLSTPTEGRRRSRQDGCPAGAGSGDAVAHPAGVRLLAANKESRTFIWCWSLLPHPLLHPRAALETAQGASLLRAALRERGKGARLPWGCCTGPSHDS